MDKRVEPLEIATTTDGADIHRLDGKEASA
jgi:hypothetical protein